MKWMYRITLFLLFAASGVCAQEKRDTIHYASAPPGKITLRKGLGLTKKQTKEFKTSVIEFRQRLQVLKNDTTLSQEEKRTQLRQLHKEKQQKMAVFLTPRTAAETKRSAPAKPQ